jgi:hypothetical protein
MAQPSATAARQQAVNAYRKAKGRPVAMRGKKFDSTGTTLAQRTQGRLKALGADAPKRAKGTSDRDWARQVLLARRADKAKEYGRRAYKRYRNQQAAGS